MPPVHSAPAYQVPLSNDELAQIGAFIVIWNQLEMLMDIAVATILGINLETTEKFIMGSPNVLPRANIYEATICEKMTDPDIRSAAHSCANQIKDMSNFRNDIAHGRWSQNTDTKSVEGRKQRQLSL